MSTTATPATDAVTEHLAQADRCIAHNYSPLPVVIASGEGAWVTDVTGRRLLDCLAAYSAVNFGHGNPEILATAASSSIASRWSAERSTPTSSAPSAPSSPP